MLRMRDLWMLAVVAGVGCHREAGPRIRRPEAAAPVARVALPAAPEPPVSGQVSPSPSHSAAPDAAPAEAPGSVETPSAPAPPFLVTELGPTQGNLNELLQIRGEYARSKQLRPIAYFYAEWCLPCRDFQNLLEDPGMVDVLRGTYIIMLNLDDWNDKLSDTGFRMGAIPSFFLVGTDGRPMGTPFKWKKEWGLKMTRAFVSPKLTDFSRQ